jgi:hypothetical protein
MEADKIEHLMQMLGCSKVKYGNNQWINATCPLAPWKHPKGRDEHPSFGISIVPGSVSHYCCHTCRLSGDLLGLIYAYRRLSKREVGVLAKYVSDHNQLSLTEMLERMERAASGWYEKNPEERPRIAGVTVSDHLASSVKPSELEKLIILPESDLDATRALPTEVMAYLLGPRRLSEESIQKWELGWHPGARRIVIPIRDSAKALVGISGRAFDEGQRPKYLHASGFRRDFYLYGEDKIKTGGTGYLCEGFFDVIYLQQRGYDAVAMMGSHLSPFQVEKLVQFFSRIVIVPDGDAPGKEAADKAYKVLGRCFPQIAAIPDGKDPDELDDDEMIGILGAPTR